MNRGLSLPIVQVADEPVLVNLIYLRIILNNYTVYNDINTVISNVLYHVTNHVCVCILRLSIELW